MYCTIDECCASKEMTMEETLKDPLAAEIVRVCTERSPGVKSGSVDRILQYMALLLRDRRHSKMTFLIQSCVHGGGAPEPRPEPRTSLQRGQTSKSSSTYSSSKSRLRDASRSWTPTRGKLMRRTSKANRTCSLGEQSWLTHAHPNRQSSF